MVTRGGRGKRWEVRVDGAVMERFSTLEQAVEAVDYEVARRGRHAAASALPGAAWRRAAVSAERAAAIVRARLRVNGAVTLGDALVLEAWARARQPP